MESGAAFTPVLANGINLPLLFMFGIAVLVPVMAFEVVVEAAVLSRIWRQPWGELCRFTFRANVWSLMAGVPVKIFNAFLYEHMLARDIPGFFATFAPAAGLGAAIYFITTVLVEGIAASRWLRSSQISVPRSHMWRALLLANVATYAVLAPIHYVFVKPRDPGLTFASPASWTTNAGVPVLYLHPGSSNLMLQYLGSTNASILIPFEVRDYLVSGDLARALFRGGDNRLYFYDAATRDRKLIWETEERFLMNQVAFSPAGHFAVVASSSNNSIEVLEIDSGRRKKTVSPFELEWARVVWSGSERQFLIDVRGTNGPFLVSIGESLDLKEEKFNPGSSTGIYPAYGRVNGGIRGGRDNWKSYDYADSCGDLDALAVPGLGSGLVITRKSSKERVLTLFVRHGLLRLAGFYMEEVAFLPGCGELVFSAEDYLYLLDVEGRRMGTLSRGRDFVLLHSKYQKRLSGPD